ncbi:MAG: hypothetical protein QOI09_257 [Chloroflexota bacterium]|nr:hypothetical protein [Chloroflexota bacterium]
MASIGYFTFLGGRPSPSPAAGQSGSGGSGSSQPTASQPGASAQTGADFRFLPAIAQPAPSPSPTPPATPVAQLVGSLDVGLVTGVSAARDGATASVRWKPAAGAATTAALRAAVDGRNLRPVRIGAGTTRTPLNLRTGHEYGYVLSAPSSADAVWTPVGLGFRLTAVDDRNTTLAYTGSWASAGFTGYLGGSARYSGAAGASVSLTFSGRSIAWVGPVGPGRGQARVEVDGATAAIVHQASGRFLPRQVLFATSWPASGRHTIRIVVGGGRGLVAVDSFAVLVGAPSPPLPPVETPPPGSSPPPATLPDATLPIRAAFYYGWYPEAWAQQEAPAYTNFHPTSGAYDSSNPATLAEQIGSMRYGGISAGLASWWGQGTRTDGRMAQLLAAARDTGLSWAINDGLEETGDPDVAQLTSALQYIATRYGGDPAYLRIGGRFVVFVSAGPNDGCPMVDRWRQANTTNTYLVLPAFPGSDGCASQPDDWYAADPSSPAQQVGQSSYTINPGFWRLNEAARLARDLDRWGLNVGAMVASGTRFQLINSFNQWADGSSVESAGEWASASGHGAFLDVLHANGVQPPVQPGDQGDATLVGAGNIAACRTSNDAATAQIVSSAGGTVFTVGDAAGNSGTPDEYRTCYGPTWGGFLQRTRPSPGTRDYRTAGAGGYFGYFGKLAGASDRGYYAYDLGSWRIYVLNSNCAKVGGCARGSPQEKWLLADLKANPHACVGAYWQEARFSSGRFGNDTRFQPFWSDLYSHGAEFVINGHDHNYQRYAPQTPGGKPDPGHGIREFIVGTGGNGHTSLLADPIPNREVSNDTAFGVLKLTLHATGYEWEFLSTARAPFTDSGAESCH